MEGVADLAARLVLGEQGQDAAFGRGQAVEVGGRGGEPQGVAEGLGFCIDDLLVLSTDVSLTQ